MILKDERITFNIKGLNFKKFLKRLEEENIEVFELERVSYNNFNITIKKQAENIFNDLCLKFNYEKNIKSETPILSSTNAVKRNLAFTLCIIFICVCLVFSCNMVYKIEIVGLQNITKQEVIKVLNDNNINTFKPKSAYDLKNIELLLKTNINKISFASAVLRGNTMILNINEKIDNSADIYDFKALVAPFDCIIEEVELLSGTLVVSKGQAVRKGESIVLPYINYKDGTQLKVEALAKVKAYVELSYTTQYTENHFEFVRSGKMQEVNCIKIFNKEFSNDFVLNFEHCEIEQNSNYVFNNFILPIKRVKTVYYELIKKQVYVPFEKVKENIIEQNKKILYNDLSKNVEKEMEVFNAITKEENVFFVTTYLKADIWF